MYLYCLRNRYFEHFAKPALVHSLSIWQEQTPSTHLPIPRLAHIASVQPEPFERQYFLPLSSIPMHVNGVVQSASSMQVNAQSLTPPIAKQSSFGLCAAQSLVLLH